MFQPKDVHSVTDFARNRRRYVKRLKASGEPAVLTVKGRAALVVQDAAAYQKLVKEADFAASVRRVGQALERMRKGERGIPAGIVLKQVRERLGLPGRS